MKFNLSHTLGVANEWLLLGLVFLLPLFFLPWSLDVLEFNKQTLLLLLVSITVLVSVGRVLHDRETVLIRGWQNALPLIVLAAWILSAVFSIGGYASWMGGSLQEYQSVLSIFALTALFYLLTHAVRHEALERRVFAALLFSGAIVLLLSLLNILGASVFPWPFLQGAMFNTIGTVNALGVFAVVMSVLGQALWLVSGREHREVFARGRMGTVLRGLVLCITLVSVLLLLSLDFWALWVLVLVGTGVLFLFGLMRAEEFPHTNRFILPMMMAVLAVFFLFLPRPFTLGFPVEVTPTAQTSWQVVQGTWREHSTLFGSGPGTYLFDYARHRLADVNETAFWDTRFDRGSSYALTTLATGGVVSGIALALMMLGLLFGSLHTLIKEREHVVWKIHFVLLSAWLTLTASAFLYSWNLTLQFLFYVFSALLATQFLRARLVKLGTSPRLQLSFSFLFVLFSIGVLTLFFVTTERHLAEMHFARAVRMDRSRVASEDIAGELERAVALNRFNDVYYRNLSEMLMFMASDLLEHRADPSALSQEEVARLQALAAASANAAKRATDLSPYNVMNWRVRGVVYRELMSLVSGSATFARLSFERVLQLEPESPVGPGELGRVHLLSAMRAGQLLQAQDVAVRDEARKTRNAELAAAEERLLEAITLKRNYAPAHFYLARVYEEQGRLDEAFAKLDSLVRTNPADVGAAFQMGQLAMRMERYERAEAEFRRALDLSPEFANARWFLASVLELRGDKPEAVKEIETLLQQQPDNTVVSARLARLKEGQASSAVPEPLDESASVVEMGE